MRRLFMNFFTFRQKLTPLPRDRARYIIYSLATRRSIPMSLLYNPSYQAMAE